MESRGPENTVNTVAVRSSVIDSIKRWSLSGIRIPKEELRQKITMPEYLRLAIRDSIASKEIVSAASHGGKTSIGGGECPLVVFINSKSSGRHGPELKARLQDLMGQEQFLGSSYGRGCTSGTHRDSSRRRCMRCSSGMKRSQDFLPVRLAERNQLQASPSSSDFAYERD
ncbi:hypothetical protein E3N88_17686 [Mikania micrantha]|uniref:DAGKc domain-containing protein n=1 Tax=Mikania micrantha TaxID=192012 RepID=A0A5N6NU03_9ASTR|nr:hypothetical protein E3N88_17686 [Mikania micrantha]